MTHADTSLGTAAALGITRAWVSTTTISPQYGPRFVHLSNVHRRQQ